MALISKLHSFAKDDLIAISQLIGFLSSKNIELKKGANFANRSPYGP
jgi:hypothetical protein